MLPVSIQVGPIPFAICNDNELYLKECKKQGEDLYGAALIDEQTILIAPEIPSDIEAETLLHEVLHVIFSQTGLELAPKKEERIIRSISPNLLDTLRRNPDLTRYLYSGSTKGKV